MGDSPVEVRREAETKLASADTFRAAHQITDAIEVLERALKLGALEPDLRAEVLIRLVDCYREINEYEVSLEHIKELIRHPPDETWLARAQVRLARAVYFEGAHQDTIEGCLTAIKTLAPTALHSDFALAQLWLGHGSRVAGLLDGARRAFTAGLAAAQRAESRRLQSACLNSLGALETRCGNLDTALWYLEDAVQVARDAGDRKNLVRAQLHRAVCHVHRGDHETARRGAIEARQLYASMNDHAGQAHTDLLLARIERRLGEDSLPALERARQHAARAEDDRLLLQVDEEAARLALAREDPSTAVGLFTELAGDRSGTHFDIATDCLEGAARAHLAVGDPANAEQSARAALQQCEISGDALSRARCLTTLTEVTGDAKFAREAATLQVRAGAHYDLSRTESVLFRMGRPETPTPKLPTAIRSAAMRETLRQADELVGFDDAILLLGEPAVGKSAVAARIAAGNGAGLLTVDCFGPSPEALREALEAARRSTHGPRRILFLNRVDRLSRECQDILVRELRHRSRSVLLSSAGNDLANEVRDGNFSADLLHRLSGCTLVVPPLRERPEDLVALAEKAAGSKLPLDLRQTLLDYPWPGNAVEVANVIHEAMHRAADRKVTPGDLPERVLRAPERDPLPVQIQRLERREIRRALSEAGGNRTKASKMLGVSRKGLIDRMKRLGLWET